jgi:hypothetical protein
MMHSIDDDEVTEAKAEAKKTVEEMLKDGLMEVVPVYLFKLNKEKANKVRWKAKEGHPSPTAAITRL